jgi:hypothetical protein
MRKPFATIAVVASLAIPALASAQVVASDASYTITRSTGAPFTSISGTGTLLAASSDDQTFSVALASPFSFYGTAYSLVSASTNGLLAFGGANASFTNADLSGGAVTGNPLVAAYWDDLYVDGPGMYSQSVGNLTTIEWNNVRFFGGADGDRITVQAILDAFTGEIVLNYFDVDAGQRGNARSATIGLQGPSSFAQAGFNQTNAVQSGDRLTISASTTVPEPSSLALSGAGVAILGLVTHLRRRKLAIIR